MSWLKEQQARVDKQEADKKAKEAEQRRFYDSMHASAWKRAERFIESHLKDLEGKMCYTNGVIDHNKEDKDHKKTKMGKFRYEADEKRGYITLYAGDTILAYLNFSWRENERYDNDGCSWGDGTYYDSDTMHLCLPWKRSSGELNDAKWHGGLWDDYLGDYLLNFMKA